MKYIYDERVLKSKEAKANAEYIKIRKENQKDELYMELKLILNEE